MYNTCDALVIGSGISGIYYSLRLLKNNPQIKITIITKAESDETATKYAQGGIAVVLNGNKIDQKKHIQDTIVAGGGMCDEKIVELVVKEGENCVNELVNWGVEFDRNRVGDFDLHLEAGHSKHRILHHRDITGKEIEASLLKYLDTKYPNVRIVDHHFAVDLYVEKQGVPVGQIGVKVLNTSTLEMSMVFAKTVLLATGGAGQIYKYTTNPSIATGDGIAMASNIGTLIKNMAFLQFHPTTFINPDNDKPFLITEALRGAGAKLIDSDNRQFMQDYDNRMELAPRDIVSRSILEEIKKGNKVFLDMSVIPDQQLKSSFPNIYKYFMDIGIDICITPVELQPAAHYLCGGISTNQWAQMPNHHNIFAVGECACTGLHGANRLASNSLLEAVVFALRAATKTEEIIKNCSDTDINKKLVETYNKHFGDKCKKKPLMSQPIQKYLKQQKVRLKQIMNDNANIIRNTKDMISAYNNVLEIHIEVIRHIKIYKPSVIAYELRNMSLVSKLILEDSISQHINIGTFFNSDYQ